MTTTQTRFIGFIQSREQARVRKEQGLPRPWSKDPILARYKFCNVNREDDAVTKWVHQYVRRRKDFSPQLMVRNVLVARIFNEPETLSYIIPSDDSKEDLRRLARLREDGRKLFRGAYMMPAHGTSGGGQSVENYYMRAVDEAMRQDYSKMKFLCEVAEGLMTARGLGDFLANQVCTDLRYTRHWGNAPDWDSFILCGPGTRRGLDRWFGYPPTGNRSQKTYRQELLDVREKILDGFDERLQEVFRDPNNLSNCFCEWDKYERAREQHCRGERITLKRYKAHGT